MKTQITLTSRKIMQQKKKHFCKFVDNTSTIQLNWMTINIANSNLCYNVLGSKNLSVFELLMVYIISFEMFVSKTGFTNIKLLKTIN